MRKCGIIGVYRREGDVAAEIYEGLLMLQHRGQDSAGIVSTDWNKFHEHKANGLVKDVFDKETMSTLTVTNLAPGPHPPSCYCPLSSSLLVLCPGARTQCIYPSPLSQGSTGLGHVRYPTAGTSSAAEAQPFFVNSPLGIYLIHNGNLTNTETLREMLSSSESFFNRHLRTESDSEVLLNIFADEIHRAHQKCAASDTCDPNTKKLDFVFEAGERIMSVLEGAYSCITLIKGVGLCCFRDPHGIRPLVLGQRLTEQGPEWAVASESCAFGPLGFELVRDVKPGEMVVVDGEGNLVTHQCAPAKDLNPCIFEYIYLARPDSVLNDISVYNFQLGLGTKLAERVRQTNWDIDCIVPVPDGSRPAAIQLSAELGLPYREGLVKNRYVGRTFIMPDQRTRELSVRRKLNAMPAVFQGKSVLLVDDSIVRGTTMSQIVNMVRQAGARKVYLASASPPVKYPNVYGVDMPSRKEFVANNLNIEQVNEVLGADGLIYQSLEDLIESAKEINPAIETYETSCFSGTYVHASITDEYLANLEAAARGKGRDRAGTTKGVRLGEAEKEPMPTV